MYGCVGNIILRITKFVRSDVCLCVCVWYGTVRLDKLGEPWAISTHRYAFYRFIFCCFVRRIQNGHRLVREREHQYPSKWPTSEENWIGVQNIKKIFEPRDIRSILPIRTYIYLKDGRPARTFNHSTIFCFVQN